MPFSEREVRQRLADLDWSQGLTRDEIRKHYRSLPDEIYIRLPSSKRFHSPDEVFHNIGEASHSRAEGEFLGPHPDLSEEGAEPDGGPPAWGESPTGRLVTSVGSGRAPGTGDMGGSSIETEAGRGIPDEESD